MGPGRTALTVILSLKIVLVVSISNKILLLTYDSFVNQTTTVGARC